ncbi:MerR family transcriptional regulator [Hyphomonas sp.]|uniref:MerR family transcriptional regulator n=1 Tax=Hyphomonas sp. TaxID=87 RepID=UPI00391C2F69
MSTFTIGRLSRESGVHIETIRFYEKADLMPEPRRSQGGRRLYTSSDAARLTFIRRARELGFPLDLIRAMMGMHDRSMTCAEVHTEASRQLALVHEKIATLTELEKRLGSILENCALTDTPDCAVIESLSA